MHSIGQSLPQGSVIPLVLFSLYSNDLPVTRGRKFIYADDIRLANQGQFFSELGAVSRQIWRECHTSVDSVDLSQVPPKQSAVCSTCIIPAPPANYLDGQCLQHECHPTYLEVTIDRTQSYREHLTKTAGKLKNQNNLLMKLAGSTWGDQRQHSAVICSGALLFSSRVLRPSLDTLCSHKSGRCAVELYYASHLRYPPFYTSPMASIALQH